MNIINNIKNFGNEKNIKCEKIIILLEKYKQRISADFCIMIKNRDNPDKTCLKQRKKDWPLSFFLRFIYFPCLLFNNAEDLHENISNAGTDQRPDSHSPEQGNRENRTKSKCYCNLRIS